MHASEIRKLGSSTDEYSKQELDRINLPRESLLDIIHKLESEIHSIQEESNSTWAELNKKKLEIKELEDQLSFIKETNKLLSSELLSIHKESQVREKSQSFEENTPESSKTQVNVLKSQKLKLLEKLKKSTLDMNSMSLENIKLQEEIDVLRFSYDSLELELTNFKDLMNNKTKKIKDALESEVEEKDKKIKNMEKEISELQQGLRKNKRNLQQEIKISKEENMKSLQDSEKELAKLRREIVENENKHQNELDAAKQKYIQLVQKNENLIKKIVELKKAQISSKQETMHIKRSNSFKDQIPLTSPNGSQTIDSIKEKLEKIYKEFLGHISRNNDGDTSIYQIQSIQLTSIEKQLNDLISLFSEKIDNSSPLKDNAIRNREANKLKHVFSWLTPRIFADSKKKRVASQRNSENFT